MSIPKRITRVSPITLVTAFTVTTTTTTATPQRRLSSSVLFFSTPNFSNNNNNNNSMKSNGHKQNNNNNNNKSSIMNSNTKNKETSSSSPPSLPTSTLTDLEKKYYHTTSHNAATTPIPLLGGGGYHRPVVQWYPGHIAKAERALAVTMKAVDVIVEVRDARIPAATAHPSVATQWCQNKPRIVVLTHMDAVPRGAMQAWYHALLQANELADEARIKTPSGNYTRGSHPQNHPPPPPRLAASQPPESTTSTTTTTTPLLSPNQMIQNQAAQVETVRIQYQPTSQVDTPTTAAKTLAKRNKMKRSAALHFRGGNHNAHQPSLVVPARAVIFVNAKMGIGIHGLSRAILTAGQYIQDRRQARGLLSRPLRVGVLGYPNVGKSALINRLIGRRRCKTANLPGVTRSLQWIRVRHDTEHRSTNGKTKKTQEFELLDSPGVIPAVLADQSDAMLLAACHCIGEASYDNQAVAAYLCEWLLAVHALGYHKVVAPHWRIKVQERYKFDPITKPKPKQFYPHEEEAAEAANRQSSHHSQRLTGEDMLYLVADHTCQGDPEDAARKILQDFRAGRMGPICLQVAPAAAAVATTNEGQRRNHELVIRHAAMVTSSSSSSPAVSSSSSLVPSTESSSTPPPPGVWEDINYIREMLNDPDDIVWQIQKQQRRLEQEQEQERAINAALENIKSRGMELPQSVLSLSATTESKDDDRNDHPETTSSTSESLTTKQKPQAPLTPTSMIGKGLFEGW